MRINAIHQAVVNKVIVLKWIDTEGNIVDVLTKSLPVLPFERHTRTLHHGFGNRPIQAKAISSVRVWRSKGRTGRDFVSTSTVLLLSQGKRKDEKRGAGCCCCNSICEDHLLLLTAIICCSLQSTSG